VLIKIVVMRKETDKKQDKNRAIHFIKKNGLTVVLGIGLIIMVVNPEAKSWVMQQMMKTGIFNAHIKEPTKDKSDKKVPKLSFRDEDGNTVNTTSLKGEVIFINFWASWCPPCIAEMPSIEKLYEKFESHPEVRFLMVNEGEKLSKAKAFLEKKEYDFPIYKVNGKIPKNIYKGVLPTTLVLDKEGEVRYHHKGFANYSSEEFFNQIENLLKE